MADIAFDPNQKDTAANTTDILSNQSSAPQQEDSQSNQSYVSTGNPYGKYASPQSNQQQSSNKSTPVKKANTSASSGQQTNVQSYINKNQAGSQNLGNAVSGKLQNSADLAKQNLQATEKSFGQGVDAGSLENWQGAVNEAKGAYQEAATQKAPERQFYENQATMYNPGTSDQDKALIASNQARVVYGDKTTKDFKTQAEAQDSINAWNKQNPGYNTYNAQNPLSVSDDRLSDILNAKYAGPTDLHQAAGYSDAYNQFNKTQSLQDLAQSKGFKGTLLKETFENPKNTYGLGNQLLDDLLLGQGQAAETLKTTADTLGTGPSGKMSDEFDRRVLDARGLAQTRSSDIDTVRKESRSALDEVALGRESDVEGRLGGILENWDKYPQYYRDILSKELTKHNSAKDQFGNFTGINNQLTSASSQLNEKPELGFGKQGQSLVERFSGLDQPRKVKDEYNNLSNKKADLEQQITTYRNARMMEPPASLVQELANTTNQMKSLTEGMEESGTSSLNEFLDRKQFQDLRDFNRYKTLSSDQGSFQNQIDEMNKKYGVDFNKFDPNSMNVGLSQLESEMLGIKGGEGLYNLLSQPGGIDNLIKTSKADKNQLISRDEQSQLSRLQSIAELANDYGSQNSGINFRNEYNNRDSAGNQNALDALDMNNLRDKLQGSEKEFQDFASAKNVTGVGTGKGSSGGAFGKKTTSTTRYLDANLGDVLNKSNGFRNMYSDEGIDQNNVNDILGLSKMLAKNDGTYNIAGETGVPQVSKMISDYVGNNSVLGKANQLAGIATGDVGATIEGIGGLTGDAANIYKNIVGDTPLLSQNASLLSGIGNVVADIGSGVSSGMFGNAAKASAKAERKAYDAAAADLQNKVKSTLDQSGYGNQFVTRSNTQRDMELLKLLGLLDTTNR